MTQRSGPLAGTKILELEAIGPGPFCAMMLADMGADVLLVDRPQSPGLGLAPPRSGDTMLRGRRSVTIDLKSPQGIEAIKQLVARADAIVEGFRPGVMERLGLGPDVLLALNPRLVYGRMTGWGQSGPLAARAGHDINYIALTGILNSIGRRDGPPVMPLNLVGDFGGGGMLLAFGIVCALVEADRSGRGQVVDAAMVDGAATLAAMFSGLLASGMWADGRRGGNALDSGAPWYDSYACRGGGWLAVGAIEPKFYAELLAKLGLDPATLPDQNDETRWPELRARLAGVIATKTRDEWAAMFAESDACVTPVLSFAEARENVHAKARASYVRIAGVDQPAPAPRFSRTPGAVSGPPPERGAGGRAALADWGFGTQEIAALAGLGLGAAR